MIRIIRTVQRKPFCDAKVWFNQIQPRGVGRRPHWNYLVCCEVLQENVVLVMREIIHDNVELYPPWIRTAHAFKRCEQIRDPLALMNRACQTISVHVVKSQELFGSREPSVRCP